MVAGWIGLLRRRWRWGLGVGGLVTATAAAVLLLTRPVYRAEASLRLGEAPPSPGVSPGGSILGFFRMGGDPFANDLELLGSRTLAEQVTEAVALDVRLVTPRGWFRDSLFTTVRGRRNTERGTYRLTWEPGGTISVELISEGDSAIGRFGPDEPIRFGGAELVPVRRRSGAPQQIDVKLVPFGEAVRVTQGRFDIERTRREANVVRIRYDDSDPKVAEDVVRATVDGFIVLRNPTAGEGEP